MATETEKESQTLDKDINDASSRESSAEEEKAHERQDVDAPSAPDEEKQKPPAGPSPPPNGGMVAWLQVLGGWMLFFNTWGILK